MKARAVTISWRQTIRALNGPARWQADTRRQHTAPTHGNASYTRTHARQHHLKVTPSQVCLGILKRRDSATGFPVRSHHLPAAMERLFDRQRLKVNSFTATILFYGVGACFVKRRARSVPYCPGLPGRKLPPVLSKWNSWQIELSAFLLPLLLLWFVTLCLPGCNCPAGAVRSGGSRFHPGSVAPGSGAPGSGSPGAGLRSPRNRPARQASGPIRAPAPALWSPALAARYADISCANDSPGRALRLAAIHVSLRTAG